MNPEDFKNKVMMPTPLPPPEEENEEPDIPEHPTAPILENMMINQDEKLSETNQLLEHILVKLDEEDDKTVEEYQLLKQEEVIEELKKLQEIVKEDHKWEVNLVIE